MINCFIGHINWEIVGVLSSCIQTIILAGSAVAIYAQLKQYRQQSIESRITGLDTALKVLDNSEHFKKTCTAIMRNDKVMGIDVWNDILETLDQITLLIGQRYTEPDLLFKLKGHEFAAIEKYLANNQVPEETRRSLDSLKYRSVRQLLKDAVKFIDK